MRKEVLIIRMVFDCLIEILKDNRGLDFWEEVVFVYLNFELSMRGE